MTPAAERRMKIDYQAAKLVLAVRRQLIEPAEGTIALVERIAAQQYDAATANHCLEQLRQMVGELYAWFDGDAHDRAPPRRFGEF